MVNYSKALGPLVYSEIVDEYQKYKEAHAAIVSYLESVHTTLNDLTDKLISSLQHIDFTAELLPPDIYRVLTNKEYQTNVFIERLSSEFIASVVRIIRKFYIIPIPYIYYNNYLVAYVYNEHEWDGDAGYEAVHQPMELDKVLALILNKFIKSGVHSFDKYCKNEAVYQLKVSTYSDITKRGKTVRFPDLLSHGCGEGYLFSYRDHSLISYIIALLARVYDVPLVSMYAINDIVGEAINTNTCIIPVLGSEIKLFKNRSVHVSFPTKEKANEFYHLLVD